MIKTVFHLTLVIVLTSLFSVLLLPADAQVSNPSSNPVTITDPNPTANEGFGWVSSDGNNILVGATGKTLSQNSVGEAFLFDKSGNVLKTIQNPSSTATSQFGIGSISGNVAIISAANKSPGIAYLFDTNTGNLLKTLQNPNTANGNSFGYSVSISGNNVLIGDPFLQNSQTKGAAYLFDASSGNLLHTFPSTTIDYGIAVFASGNNLLVGSDASDSVDMYDASSGNLLKTFHNPNPGSNNWFGESLAMSGNNVIIGAPHNSISGKNNAGTVYLFDAASGNLLQTIQDPTPVADDLFGWSVSISGNNILVGSIKEGSTTSSPGSAYLFTTSGNLLQTYQSGSNIHDRFGWRVAFSGTNAVVGSMFYTVSSQSNVGAVFIFPISSTPVTSPDTIPPVVTQPQNLVTNATSPTGAIVTYPQPTATDNVGVTSGPTCAPSSGSLFPIGTTTVTCTASDAAGNIGKSMFTVTVNPFVQTPPSGPIILPTILKTIAGEWSQSTISDFDFLQSVQYLMNQGTMTVPHNTLGYNSSSGNPIPSWIKNNAGWWANGKIDNQTFASGIQYLFADNYLPVSVHGIPSPISNAQNQNPQPTPSVSITVSTDRSSYNFGDTITVFGTVSSVTAGTPLTIRILDPSNNLVQVNQASVLQNGMYTDSIPITSSLWKSSGTYTVQAQYGSSTITSQTTISFYAGSPISSTSEIDIAKGAGGSAQAACVSTNNCFNPNPLTVAPGTTVTWKNTDTVMHVICSGKVTDDECGKVFEDDTLKPGTTFQFTFANPGTYDYYCSVHPWMTGQVIVGASSSIPSTTNATTQTSPQTATITATTDKSSYTTGDEIVVTGTISSINQVNPQQPIVIQTYDPNNELVRIDQTVPSSFGTYSLTIPAHGPLWQSAGTYTLKVQYDVNTHSTLTFSFNPSITQSQQIQITSGGSLNVGFSTDPINPSTGMQTQLKINFLNKQSGSLQQHIDYKITVNQGTSQIFGIPVTHTAEGAVSVPIQFTNGGNYVVTVEVDGILFQPLPPQTATFNLSVSGQQTSTLSGINEIDISPGAGASAQATCVTNDDCFTPNPLHISPGTTVTWKNTDTVMHVICSGKVTDPECGKVFEDDTLKPGQTFQFTFANPGTYDYFCSVHPWMTGQVIVGNGISNPTGNWTQSQLSSHTTTQDIQNINQARADGTIAAEVNVGNNRANTTSIDNNVSVQTTQTTPDSLGVKVSAPDQTGPKVIVFNLNATTINVSNLKDLGVMYDGKLLQPAPNMDAILHAKSTDNPSFAIVVTQSGVQVLVLIPHFSTHSITITNMSKVITPAIPEFPFAAIVLIIAIFSIILISRLNKIQIR